MSARFSRMSRYVALFAIDMVSTLVLFLFSCWASLDNSIFSPGYWSLLLVGVAWAVVPPILFAALGLYRIAMSRIGLFESLKIVLVTASVDVTFYLMLFIGQSIPNLSIPWVLNWRVFLLMVLVHVFATVAIRFVPRSVRALRNRSHIAAQRTVTLMLGVSDASRNLIEESRVNPDSTRRFVAILDDDPLKWGTTVAGVKVYGGLSQARERISELGIEEVILDVHSLTPAVYADLVAELSSCDVRLRKTPHGDLDKVNEGRVVDISYRDLLGRPDFPIHEDEVKAKFQDSCCLITGGGGTIGGELAMQLLSFGAKRIVLLDRYENGLAEVTSRCRDLIRRDDLEGRAKPVLCDVEDYKGLSRAMKEHRPDYVFHCGAVKHVPLAEDHPSEAISTNVLGTDTVCRCCIENRVKEMYFLSTDKAAHPDSVMSRTKRLGEIACAYYGEKQRGTRFVSLRFGNVLASKGSVVKIFTKQIAAGGPVTVTSEEAARYFFTLEDCVRLILDATALSKDNALYDLEAGRSTRIIALAESLIRQAGYIPYKDIDIVIMGLRHGEATPVDAPYDRQKQTPTQNEHIYSERVESDLDYPKVLVSLSTDDPAKAKSALERLNLD